MKKTVVISFLIIISSLIITGCSNAEITVHAVGKSDRVSREVIEISIHETADSVESAKEKAESSFSAVESTIQEMELEPFDFSIRSSHSGEYDGKYYYTKDMQVSITGDIERDLFIERVTSAGASGVHSFWGALSPEISDESLPVGYDEIIAEAELKAEKIAAASNGRIGRIIAVEESSHFDDSIQISVTYEFIPE